METVLVGNLRDLTAEAIIDAMENAEANFNLFPACFAEPPKFEDIIEAAHSAEYWGYPDMDSFMTYHAGCAVKH